MFHLICRIIIIFAIIKDFNRIFVNEIFVNEEETEHFKFLGAKPRDRSKFIFDQKQCGIDEFGWN